MIDALNAILVAVLVLNLLALGTGRILAVVRIIAVQGALLGVLPLLVHDHLTPAVFVVAAATIAFKGFAIPAILGRALGDAKVKHEIKPAFGLLPKYPFQLPAHPGSYASPSLSGHRAGQVLASLLMAIDRPTLIDGSDWRSPGRGSNRMIFWVYGLSTWRSRKPVSMIYAGVPFRCITLPRTNGVIPSV